MTRTIPVNGKFTPRQKQVYNAVLRVQRLSRKLIVPGAKLSSIFEKTRSLIEKELIELGLLSKEDIKNQNPEKPASLKYFPQRIPLPWPRRCDGGLLIASWWGYGSSCELGIYIREENLA
jgi:Xaa-Pro aminopeptidase